MNNEEISIIELFYMVTRNKVLIAAVTLAFLIIGVFYTEFIVTPVYTARGTLYVTIDNNYSAQSNVNIDDIMAAQKLTNTYIAILTSNTFYKTVAAEAGLDYNYKQIKAMTSVAAKDESEIITIVVNCPSPEDAAIITSTILNNSQSEISRLVVGGSSKIIDNPEIPTRPSSPSLPKNCAVSVLLGLIVSCGINFLISFFDDSIKSSSSLVKNFKIPVLAEIPVCADENGTNL